MKKVFMIIGGIFCFMLVVGLAIYIYTSATSEKLVCTSSQGDITIMYKKDKITGSKTKTKTKRFTYDLDGQNAYAQQIGIDAYLEEFTSWFEENTDGTCK